MASIVKEGSLLKCPKDDKSGTKKWRARWFVLKRKATDACVLEYYKNQTKKKRKRELDLSGEIQLAVVPDYGRSYEFVFYIVTLKRKLYLAASSQTDRDAWVGVLGRMLNQEVQVQLASIAKKKETKASPSRLQSISSPSKAEARSSVSDFVPAERDDTPPRPNPYAQHVSKKSPTSSSSLRQQQLPHQPADSHLHFPRQSAATWSESPEPDASKGQTTTIEHLPSSPVGIFAQQPLREPEHLQGALPAPGEDRLV